MAGIASAIAKAVKHLVKEQREANCPFNFNCKESAIQGNAHRFNDDQEIGIINVVDTMRLSLLYI